VNTTKWAFLENFCIQNPPNGIYGFLQKRPEKSILGNKKIKINLLYYPHHEKSMADYIFPAERRRLCSEKNSPPMPDLGKGNYTR
jgi:hypothetical protein